MRSRFPSFLEKKNIRRSGNTASTFLHVNSWLEDRRHVLFSNSTVPTQPAQLSYMISLKAFRSGIPSLNGVGNYSASRILALALYFSSLLVTIFTYPSVISPVQIKIRKHNSCFIFKQVSGRRPSVSSQKSSASTPSYRPERIENRCSTQKLYLNVHSSSIYNSSKTDTTKWHS